LVAYDQASNKLSDSFEVTVNPMSEFSRIDPMITNVLSLIVIVVVILMGYRIVKSGTEQKNEKDWKDMMDDFTQS
jgi:hypothetical protein